jgi:hypothetical protein
MCNVLAMESKVANLNDWMKFFCSVLGTRSSMDVTTNVGQVSPFENYSWYWYGIFPKKAYQPGAGIGILFILECYRYWIFFKTFIPALS